MSSAFVHYRNTCTSNGEVSYIRNVTVPTEETIEKLGTNAIYRKMYMIKSHSSSSNEKSLDSLKTFTFSQQQKKSLVEAINRYSMGRLRQRSNRIFLHIFEDRPLIYQGKNKFTWCSGIKFCAITQHANAKRNPCDYYIVLNPKQYRQTDKRECYIYCRCFSTICQEHVRHSYIWKCLI